MKQFVESQTELFKYIKRKIIEKVVTGNLLGSQAKDYWFATKLIQKARFELYDPTYSSTKPFLRRQLEKQLTDKKERINLLFNGVKVPGTSIDFVLTIKQSEVLNIDFRSWGLNKKLHDYGIYKNSKPLYMNHFIQDTTDYLKTLIKILTGGKARIFILTDTGDADLGYQYLVPQQKEGGEFHTAALRSRQWLPKGPSYFDIDLTSENSQDRLILEYLVNVMLGTTDLIVIKEEEGTIDDGKMICAFNQYRFFRPNDINSGPSDGKVYDSLKFNNYQVKITEQSIKFYKRGSQWFNYMGWSFGPNSEFYYYLNSILNDPENYLNQFLIAYTK